MPDLTESILDQITINMQHLAVLGESVGESEEARNRRHQLGMETGELLVGCVLTATDLGVRTSEFKYPPIYAYDLYNDGAWRGRDGGSQPEVATPSDLRQHDHSSNWWIPRALWFKSKREHTGRVAGIDVDNASIVMARRSDRELFATRWWVTCADSQGIQLVKLALPETS